MQIRIREIGQKCWKSSDIDRKTPNILRMFGELSWQGMRDSNPRKRSQSPVCYRYTNPLCLADVFYYTPIFPFVNPEF